MSDDSHARCLVRIAELEAAAPKWIPVTERLPEDNTPVLVLLSGEVHVGELIWEHPSFEDNYKAFRYWDDAYDDGKCWEWHDITHWMPLPEPPLLGGGD